jgi:hypothetical protein
LSEQTVINIKKKEIKLEKEPGSMFARALYYIDDFPVERSAFLDIIALETHSMDVERFRNGR